MSRQLSTLVLIVVGPWITSRASAAPYFSDRPDLAGSSGHDAGLRRSWSAIGCPGPIAAIERLLKAQAGSLTSETDIAEFDPELLNPPGIVEGFPLKLPEEPLAPSVEPSAPGSEIAVGDLPANLRPIPEPTSLVLLVTGLIGLWCRSRLRRRPA